MKLRKTARSLNSLMAAIDDLKCQKTMVYDDAYLCVKNPDAAINILIIGGIHGDEPAGVLAAVELASMDYIDTQCVKILPCANPVGYVNDTRENGDKEDINRQFDDGHTQEEEKILKDLVAQADILITLHEDDTHDGCYVYAPTVHQDVGHKALAEMSKTLPIENSKSIFGDPTDRGLITNFDLKKPKHGNSIEGYGKKLGVPSFCLEVPGKADLTARINALVDGCVSIMQSFQ